MNGDHNHGQSAQHVDPLLSGYALDALDAAERHEVKTHLRICPRCRREADRDRAVAAQIGFAVPRHAPPPDLKHRVMARLVREGMRPPDGRGVAPSPNQASVAPPTPLLTPLAVRARRAPARWLLAAAIMPWLIALALSVLLAGSLHRKTPSMAVAQVAGGRDIYGWVTMAPGGTSANLVLVHMPSLPPNERYVCWLDNGQRVDRACVFRPPARRDATIIPVSAPQPMDRYARITVTVEKGAPSSQRTGPFLASGWLR